MSQYSHGWIDDHSYPPLELQTEISKVTSVILCANSFKFCSGTRLHLMPELGIIYDPLDLEWKF